jgi:Icc-related predicted phosphoesterase
MPEANHRVRIAAVADLHYDKSSSEIFKPVFSQLAGRADLLLVCGDLTDYGLADEARLLAKDLVALKMPVLAVLGNHDYQADQQEEIAHALSEAGVTVLSGQAVEVMGIGFAGAKGFAGGFGVRTLEPWGEQSIKRFVQESLDEAMRLELALSRLRTPQRVAMLHYAPIQATVEGEPPEIYAFLGSSRLEEPLNRYKVSLVFHGHAHHGQLEGRTSTGIPVYNVSFPLLRRTRAADPPVRIVELEVGETARPPAEAKALSPAPDGQPNGRARREGDSATEHAPPRPEATNPAMT